MRVKQKGDGVGNVASTMGASQDSQYLWDFINRLQGKINTFESKINAIQAYLKIEVVEKVTLNTQHQVIKTK